MRANKIILLIPLILLSGCYNRYKAPLIWQNMPYPFVQTGLIQLPCQVNKVIEIEIVDKRRENIGKKVGTTKFKSDLVLDNELSNLGPFLANRFCTYFRNIHAMCVDKPSEFEPAGKLQIVAKTIAPDIRGAFWITASGIVDLQCFLTNKSDTLVSHEFIAVAQDGDPDVPIGKYSAVTFELGGKLVTATSLKRIADSLSVLLCDNKDKLGQKKVNEI